MVGTHEDKLVLPGIEVTVAGAVDEVLVVEIVVVLPRLPKFIAVLLEAVEVGSAMPPKVNWPVVLVLGAVEAKEVLALKFKSGEADVVADTIGVKLKPEGTDENPLENPPKPEDWLVVVDWVVVLAGRELPTGNENPPVLIVEFDFNIE